MARGRTRRRRVWDTYLFPGCEPESTVRGVFCDTKARVIKLKRRSKKQHAGAAVASRGAGTTARFAGCAICPAGTRGYIWKRRCGGGGGAGCGKGKESHSDFWRAKLPPPQAFLFLLARAAGRRHSKVFCEQSGVSPTSV